MFGNIMYNFFMDYLFPFAMVACSVVALLLMFLAVGWVVVGIVRGWRESRKRSNNND